MKIFLSFLQANQQHPIAAYSFWEYYIKNGIEEAGHQWIECNGVDWARGLVPQSKKELEDWRSESWEKTIQFLKKDKPDLFLSYLYPQQIEEHAILEIKKMGIYCVNFFCDNVRLFQKIPKAFAPFDLNWVPEFKAIPLYQKANLPHLNLPMPMWVEPKYRTPAPQENTAISFIGSKDLQRHLFFEELIRHKNIVDLAIYGSGWKEESKASISPSKGSLFQTGKNQIDFIFKYGVNAYINKVQQLNHSEQLSEQLQAYIKGKPNFDAYVKITRESLVTIGINRYPSYTYPLHRPNTYSRLRDIEAPMLGACYLTEYTEGLEELYELGNEIETFRTTTELLEKIEELRSNPERRAKLRENGQRRALQTNSIINSIQAIQKQITGIF